MPGQQNLLIYSAHRNFLASEMNHFYIPDKINRKPSLRLQEIMKAEMKENHEKEATENPQIFNFAT